MPRTASYDRHEALGKALDLFWRRGYHASSLKHLGQALDMRPGSFYAAFGSKQDLFVEVLDEYAGQMAELLASHLAREATALDALKAYLSELVLGCVPGESPPVRACMVVKTLLEVTDEDEPLRSRVNQMLTQTEQAIADLLKQAQAAGEIRPDVDPTRLARVVQVQMMGLRTFAQRDLGRAQLEPLVADIFALLDGYRVHH